MIVGKRGNPALLWIALLVIMLSLAYFGLGQVKRFGHVPCCCNLTDNFFVTESAKTWNKFHCESVLTLSLCDPKQEVSYSVVTQAQFDRQNQPGTGCFHCIPLPNRANGTLSRDSFISLSLRHWKIAQRLTGGKQMLANAVSIPSGGAPIFLIAEERSPQSNFTRDSKP